MLWVRCLNFVLLNSANSFFFISMWIEDKEKKYYHILDKNTEKEQLLEGLYKPKKVNLCLTQHYQNVFEQLTNGICNQKRQNTTHA